MVGDNDPETMYTYAGVPSTLPISFTRIFVELILSIKATLILQIILLSRIQVKSEMFLSDSSYFRPSIL